MQQQKTQIRIEPIPTNLFTNFIANIDEFHSHHIQNVYTIEYLTRRVCASQECVMSALTVEESSFAVKRVMSLLRDATTEKHQQDALTL